MKICVECGQKWWRYSSWKPGKNFFRKFKYSTGFAVGPILFVFKEPK